MSAITDFENIAKARNAINAILAQLEIETGMLVDRVGIVDIDITNIENPRQELLRSVAIHLKPLPGSRWTK